MQLGPVIMSRFSKERGLAVSTLERFITEEPAYSVAPPSDGSQVCALGLRLRMVVFIVRS